jgi:HlyD family secretion protein
VQFELDRRSDVLLVSNAALRWTPSVEQIAPQLRENFENPADRKKTPERSPRPTSGPGRGPDDMTSRGVVWIAEGAYVRPLRLRVGLTDGTMTEVEGEGLTEGLGIITGLQTQVETHTDASNPFLPRLPSRTGKSGGPPPPPI